MPDESAATAAKATGDDPDKNRRLAAVNAAAEVGRDPQAKPKEDLTDRQAMDATDWFLSSEEEEDGWKDFDLNVSNGDVKKWVRFRVQASTRERIDQIRDQNTMTVLDAKGVEEKKPDGPAISLRTAVEGLVRPDLSKPEARRVRGQDYMDPADALAARFAHKPGLIDQIAGQVIAVTGYDDEDMREVAAGKS